MESRLDGLHLPCLPRSEGVVDERLVILTDCEVIIQKKELEQNQVRKNCTKNIYN